MPYKSHKPNVRERQIIKAHYGITDTSDFLVTGKTANNLEIATISGGKVDNIRF